MKGRVQWCKGLEKWRDVDHGEQRKGIVQT